MTTISCLVHGPFLKMLSTWKICRKKTTTKSRVFFAMNFSWGDMACKILYYLRPGSVIRKNRTIESPDRPLSPCLVIEAMAKRERVFLSYFHAK